jgi:hypothetical protein
MNYKLADLHGVNQDYIVRLHETGIQNTNDLMHLWNDPAKLSRTATSTGIGLAPLTNLVSMARMARMKGVGPKYVGLLVAAGVIGRRSLSKYTPETLVRRLNDVSAGLRLKGGIPTLLEVGAWFTELKPIPDVLP